MFGELDNAAQVIASAATALIRALGMQAENQLRERRGEAQAYTEADFLRIIKEEGIDFNAVITTLRR